MKRSRFTEEQIACTLKKVELGIAVGEVCRNIRIAWVMFYVRRKRTAGKVRPGSSGCDCWRR
ncbi:hypothetical protein [Stenotrophomonas sp. CFBP 13718]|uniref:hypothetical protein n=1 Tax=Stenotrophomonas sp. CFBP 13718 TaxID=2775304 RepID=UPI0017810DDA|nr:hypothetical protein [Stenotrophomonas sp. CFBP 13718]MBD8696046.1 hypothetical protein [Stenotrophomonas sp. CFBP 13718]